MTKSTNQETIAFYDVPLVCGAAPSIGCGSRAKPLLVDLEQELLQDARGKFQEAILNVYEKHVGVERTAEVQARRIQNSFDRADREETSSCCP